MGDVSLFKCTNMHFIVLDFSFVNGVWWNTLMTCSLYFLLKKYLQNYSATACVLMPS